MQEIISQIVARVQTIFSQLGDQVRAAMENAAAGKAILAALDVILPVASGVLRILAVFVAILIIVRCCRSIFREKPGKEIWGWLTLADGARLELCHWENALGRGKWADVDLDFPTVSRSHAALLRDHKGNWTLQPLQTKNGTRVNGKKVTTTVPVQTGDVIDLGGVGMEFYAISEAEEREQAMRWGVAERPLSPGRTLGCLMVFQLMLAVQCLPGREKSEVAMIAVAFGILMAAMWFTYGIYRALKRTAFEAETIAFFLCSICFGITAAYSPKSLLTQTICLLLGIAVFLTLSVLLRDLKATLSLRWPVAVLTCLLLIFNVVLGSRIFGAKNWISIGPIGFQPSEFVKIAFIFTGAATLDRLFARRNLIFTVLFCGFCMGCLALMSDFGTALIFFVALLVIAFLRSGDVGFLALMATAAGAGGWIDLAVQALHRQSLRGLAPRLGARRRLRRLPADPHHVRHRQRRPLWQGDGGRLVPEKHRRGQHGPGLRRHQRGVWSDPGPVYHRDAAGAGVLRGPVRVHRPVQLLRHCGQLRGGDAGVPGDAERAGCGGHPAPDGRDLPLCVHGRVQHDLLLGPLGLHQGGGHPAQRQLYPPAAQAYPGLDPAGFRPDVRRLQRLE